MGVLSACRSCCRVLAVLAVHLVEVLRLDVKGLEIGIFEGPCGGDSAVMNDFTEVLGTQPEQGGAVELRVTADVVVDLGLELVAVPVVPLLLRQILALDEYGPGIPIVELARQERPSLQPQDALSARGESVTYGSAASAGGDDHHVVMPAVCHFLNLPKNAATPTGNRRPPSSPGALAGPSSIRGEV